MRMQAQAQKTIIRVAVPVPLRQCFDYLMPDDTDPELLRAGLRVLVPFGRVKLVGIIDAVVADSSVESARLKHAIHLLDEKPLLNSELMQLCHWTSQYYHHPLGEVYATALPARLRQDRPAAITGPVAWCLTELGRSTDVPARAFRQVAMMTALRQAVDGLTEAQLDTHSGNWKVTMRSLEAKGWVECRALAIDRAVEVRLLEQGLALNDAQQQAVSKIMAGLDRFGVFLLHGVTGSGKTEVYLQTMTTVLQQGRQVLILVPEIGLTPQLMQRFKQRFDVPMAIFHSGLNDGERAYNWLQAQSGQARIVIGTRSAVFAAMPEPGLIIVDEEHDLSFKQQDGCRYSARDVAIVRARHNDIPIILGSATPSLESIMNSEQQRYQLLELPERAAAATHPAMYLVDLKHQHLDEGLSEPLINKIHEHVDSGGQALLFLNRRGYAPTLLCHDCGWTSQCQRCDAHMTLHQASGRLRCHHCGSERRPDSHCPACGSADLRPIGQGTERTEEALQRLFPDKRIARIDRDTTRRKGAMEQKLKDAESGRDQILLGTQLLAKGHHFPNLSLVAVLDSDQGLFSADFRSAERMAQLIMQVSGRAGRADRAGEVLIQTHHPEHELLQYAVRQDYPALSRYLLQERQTAQWPPYSYLAMLRAEATQQSMPIQFLRDAVTCASDIPGSDKVMLLGPVAAPMEKRAGRYRAQLLLQSPERADLHGLISAWLPQIEQLKSSRKVRWSLDIDPQDMF